VQAPVLRPDYALIGVPVPPGRHEVVLSYRPLQIVARGAVTLVTVLILAAAAIRPA